MLTARVSLLSILVFLSYGAFADEVPVVDLSQNVNTVQQPATDNSLNNSNPVILQSLTLDQRVARLETQMSNLAQMNLPGEIQDIQQQIQQINGQLQVQAHSIETLDQQQRNFYQDIDQRLTQLKNLIDGQTNTSSVSNSASVRASQLAQVKKGASLNHHAGNASGKSGNNGSGDAEQDYQKAFNLLANKKYDEAKSAFQQFLQNNTDSSYVPNAHYWLGEIYLQQKQNKLALQEFNTVINDYNNNSKVPDAILKRATIYTQQGKNQQAKQDLQVIIKKYPDSSAARLASMQLKTLS